MSVDIEKIGFGDLVTLGPLTVSEEGGRSTIGSHVLVMFPDSPDMWVPIEIVKDHQPAPRAIKMGQQVLKMEDIYGAAVTGPWLVIGIHKERVWLGSPEGEREWYATANRYELKHMDGTRVEP